MVISDTAKLGTLSDRGGFRCFLWSYRQRWRQAGMEGRFERIVLDVMWLDKNGFDLQKITFAPSCSCREGVAVESNSPAVPGDSWLKPNRPPKVTLLVGA